MRDVLVSVMLPLVLFLSSGLVARGAADSYRLLEIVLCVSVFLAGLGAALFLPYSFAPLLLSLSGPAVLGVVAGSWPDVGRRWPSLFLNDLRAVRHAFPRNLPGFAGGAAGLGVGLWAWSSLADSWGVLGVVLGTYVFVVIVLAGAFAPFLFAELVQKRRDPSP